MAEPIDSDRTVYDPTDPIRLAGDRALRREERA